MKRTFLLALIFSTQASFAATAAKPAPDLAKAAQIAETVCAACHSKDGNSIIAANPKLAGQHAAYIEKQLHNFKPANGKPAERNNAIMAGMAGTLTPEDMRSLAAYFAQQKIKPEAAKNKATVEFGQRLWRAGDAGKGIPSCAGCHGPAGAGLPAQYPRLAGQFAEYTEAQLRNFRDGVRANDAGEVMRNIALRMTEPEIKAIADYIAGLR